MTKPLYYAVCISTGVTGAAITGFALFYLGFFTGVFGICATAPKWWFAVFLWLLPVITLIGGIASFIFMLRFMRSDLRESTNKA